MSRRTTRDGEPAKSLTIRIYDEDRSEWEQLAEESGSASLTEWIVKACKAEVERVRRGKRSKT